MTKASVSRRTVMLGVFSLPGCTTLSLLSNADVPRDTYDLRPLTAAGTGPRTRRTLLVAPPTAPAAISTDRILIRPDTQSIAYLPDARWSDDAPRLLQSLLVQSLSASGRIRFVGMPNAGPVPDFVLLTRVDRFDVAVLDRGAFRAVLAFEATVLRDRDQHVIGVRSFAGSLPLNDDRSATIVGAFQQLLDTILTATVHWVNRQVISS